MFRSVMVLIFTLLPVAAGQAQNYEYAVKHHHTLKDCQGTLKITPEGVEYRTSDSKDARKWKFEEIRVIEVKSPTRIFLVSYEDQKLWMGKDKVFEFTLVSKKADPELSSFLLSRVKRPMQVAVIPADTEKPVFEMAAKRLHTIVGTMGVLRIYNDRIVFRSSKNGESRYWRYTDIERFSQPDRFRFQIVSYEPKAGGPTEAYNFQLMEDLPEGVYDYIWQRLHPLSYYPEVRR